MKNSLSLVFNGYDDECVLLSTRLSKNKSRKRTNKKSKTNKKSRKVFTNALSAVRSDKYFVDISPDEPLTHEYFEIGIVNAYKVTCNCSKPEYHSYLWSNGDEICPGLWFYEY